MKIRSLFSSVFFGLVALIPSVSTAHSVWIEEVGEGNLAVRFAQWGEDFETSPGQLDSFALVSGWTFNDEGKSQILDVEKKKDQFFLAKSENTKPTFAQAHFAIRKLHDDKPARAPIFYCRWQPEGAGEAKPAMTMDIVPTGKAGEARVFFRGKPLADTEVEFFAPAADGVKLKTNAEGLVTAPDISKPGPYLLTIARYSEELPGFFNGVPFAITSHSASLYWMVKKKD